MKFRIYVLNLDRDADRLQHMQNQLSAIGAPWVRVSGVLGSALSKEELDKALDREAFQRKHGMTPALGEVGCYLSHIKAHQEFLASSDDFAIILEDDIVIGQDLLSTVAGLITHQSDWDMVKLSQIHSGSPVRTRELGNGRALAIMLSQCTGSSAYIINRNAASAYLKHLLPMSLPYDHAFDRSWSLGIKVRLVTPPPCEHNYALGTTIITQGQSRKFKWYRRLPTYQYRLINELSRITWALKQLWTNSTK